MQIYQRVFLITSTLESSTATSFVSCLLVLSYDLFSLNYRSGKDTASFEDDDDDVEEHCRWLVDRDAVLGARGMKT